MLLRKQTPPPKAPPQQPKPAPTAASLSAEADELWKAYKGYVDKATPQLSRVKERLVAHMAVYKYAWDDFTKALKDAEKSAAEREKWTDMVKNLLIGTGIGLAAGELYAAQTLVRKVLYELASESAEYAANQAAQSAGPDFAPPGDLSADKFAADHWKLLSGAWESLALLQPAGLQFVEARDDLRKAAEGLKAGKGGPDAAKHQATVDRIVKQDAMGKLRRALADTERAMKHFMTAVDTPMLHRDAAMLERDLWIRWVSRINKGRKIVFKDVSTWDMETNRQAREDYKRLYDALDEGPVKARLKQLGFSFMYSNFADSGVEMEEFMRFYHWSMGDAESMQFIGRLGVVVLAPPEAEAGQVRSTQPGIIKLRHDLYTVTDRTDPEPGGPARYLRVENDPGTPLEVGQVVMVWSTSRSTRLGGFEARPLSPSPGPQRVRHDESNDALRALGYDMVSYTIGPTSGDSLSGLTVENLLAPVAQALGPPALKQMKWKIKEVPGKGVLISEPDGTPILLVAPLGPLTTPGVAMAMRDTGAPRGIAVSAGPADKDATLPHIGVYPVSVKHLVLAIQHHVFTSHDEVVAKRKAQAGR